MSIPASFATITCSSSTPLGALYFLGFGARAERLRRFAFDDAADPDPFIARCRAVAIAAESGRLAKARRTGVPRAVLAILLGTAASFHLSTAPILMILGIDALIDMGRTSLNVFGNCLASAVVARWDP